jgi:hypothetical protein
MSDYFSYRRDLYFYGYHRYLSYAVAPQVFRPADLGKFFRGGRGQVIVATPHHGHTISHSPLAESCSFSLSRICTPFYLGTYSYALKMEAVRSSEMLVRFYQSIRHHIPQDNSLHSERRENLILLQNLFLCLILF